MMVIFTLFFVRLAGIPSNNVPYPLFALTALLPWMQFAEGMTRSKVGMVTNANIMTKVYFPRLIMPVASILSPLVDFIVAFRHSHDHDGLLRVAPTLNVIFLPLVIIFAMMTSLAVGLWLSALNVKYRDFQYTIPFLIQIWLFASPVVYPVSMIP
jgi:lipopolysaccharide transport system permease protein